MMDKKEQNPDPQKQSVKEAARTATADIRNDPESTPDNSSAADMDEGELARLDNSND